MRVLLIIAALAAGFMIYQDHESKTRQNSFNDLVKTIEQTPVNQYDLKQSLITQVTARCESLKAEDDKSAQADSCLDMVENYQQDCELQIFRLAPIEFESEKEAVDYGKRYQRCVFSKQFSYLI